MTIRNRIGLGFVAAFCIVIANGLVTYWSTAKLIETSRLVSHTHEVLEKMETLLSLMKDVESGQWGYIITGKDEFLDAHCLADPQVERSLKALKKLTADNSSQQQRLLALQPVIEERRSISREGVRLRKEKGFVEASKLVSTGKERGRWIGSEP